MQNQSCIKIQNISLYAYTLSVILRQRETYYINPFHLSFSSSTQAITNPFIKFTRWILTLTVIFLNSGKLHIFNKLASKIFSYLPNHGEFWKIVWREPNLSYLEPKPLLYFSLLIWFPRKTCLKLDVWLFLQIWARF